MNICYVFFFFSSRRRHTRLQGDWSSDVCSSDLGRGLLGGGRGLLGGGGGLLGLGGGLLGGGGVLNGFDWSKLVLDYFLGGLHYATPILGIWPINKHNAKLNYYPVRIFVIRSCVLTEHPQGS